MGIDDQSKMSGAHSAKLVHSEIVHIRLVIERLTATDLAESGLPLAYWRKRLQSIMQNYQLSQAHFHEIDRILDSLKE
ncbi:hypothetical protein [Paraburkholderia sp. GAS41]|uniref:hypothetical protein n=1 Tax=Paraburkholderia sp. GAS41 TaxID=3035134 RepID=UPI003D20838B